MSDWNQIYIQAMAHVPIANTKSAWTWVIPGMQSLICTHKCSHITKSNWHVSISSNPTQVKNKICGLLRGSSMQSNCEILTHEIEYSTYSGCFPVHQHDLQRDKHNKGQQPLSTPRTMVHSSLNQKNQWQPSHKRDAATRWTLNPVSIKYTQPPHTPTQWWTSYLKVCERMRMQLTSHHEFIVDALKYWSVRGRATLKLINQAWTFCANRWDKHERQIGVYLQAQSKWSNHQPSHTRIKSKWDSTNAKTNTCQYWNSWHIKTRKPIAFMTSRVSQNSKRIPWANQREVTTACKTASHR